jgi:hypothetical protein
VFKVFLRGDKMGLFGIRVPEKKIKIEHEYSYRLEDYDKEKKLKSFVVFKDGQMIFRSKGYSEKEVDKKASEYIMEND